MRMISFVGIVLPRVSGGEAPGAGQAGVTQHPQEVGRVSAGSAERGSGQEVGQVAVGEQTRRH